MINGIAPLWVCLEISFANCWGHMVGKWSAWQDVGKGKRSLICLADHAVLLVSELRQLGKVIAMFFQDPCHWWGLILAGWGVYLQDSALQFFGHLPSLPTNNGHLPWMISSKEQLLKSSVMIINPGGTQNPELDVSRVYFEWCWRVGDRVQDCNC